MVRKYGIDEAKYDAELRAQDSKCAICKIPAEESKGRNPGRLVIDHDHGSGGYRGLLCNTCNLILGLVKDDAATLERAASYIRAKSLAAESRNNTEEVPTQSHEITLP